MKRKRKKKEGGKKKVICVHRERSPHCKMKKKKQVKREWKGCIKGNTVESESCHQISKKNKVGRVR